MKVKCDKVRYSIRDEATQAMAGLHQDPRNKGKRKPHKAYLCPDCNGWHVASNRKKKITNVLPESITIADDDALPAEALRFLNRIRPVK